MLDTGKVLGAFSEDQVASLTGVSVSQLRAWHRRGFIRAAYTDETRSQFKFVYSFRDLIKLRVLNELRNNHSVPMAELEKVEKVLAHLGDAKWITAKLWVLNKKVVFNEPQSSRKREITTGQFIVEIPLEIVISDVRVDIQRLNARPVEQHGSIVRIKNLYGRAEVFSGTRIPVQAIQDYISSGYADKQIIDDFPDLTSKDLRAAENGLISAAA